MFSRLGIAFLVGLFVTPSLAQTPQVAGDLLVKLVDDVDVPALETGALVAMDVRVGDSVTAGQRLAQIDDRPASARLRTATAEFEVVEKRASIYRDDELSEQDRLEKLELLKQQRVLAEISEQKSENEVQSQAAKKAEAVAKNEWMRASKARESFIDAVSESELENLRLRYERSQLERQQAEFDRRMNRLTSSADQAALRAAEIAAERATIERDVAKAQRSVLEFDVKAKSTAVGIGELTVQRHVVSAPIDGVVADIQHRKGEWVRPGETVVRIVSLKRLHAEGYLIGETHPARGTKVTLTRDGEEIAGEVVFVSPEQDPVSGEVRFLVEFPGGVFRPGQRVNIRW